MKGGCFTLLNLSYDAVHRFVEGHPQARWDGWTVELFKPSPAGATHPKGAFRNGQWGILTRVGPDEKGKWRLNV
jgi:hypothetical protein